MLYYKHLIYYLFIHWLKTSGERPFDAMCGMQPDMECRLMEKHGLRSMAAKLTSTRSRDLAGKASLQPTLQGTNISHLATWYLW